MNTSSLILGIIALFGALFYASIFIYGLFDPLSPLAVEPLFGMLFLGIATSCGWLAIFFGLVSITKKKNPGFKKGVVGAVLGLIALVVVGAVLGFVFYSLRDFPDLGRTLLAVSAQVA